MDKTKKLTLIEGTFSPAEAQEVLMNIFFTKINFHEMKNFSSQERFGKIDENASNRILSLRSSINTFLNQIKEAKENQKDIIITSEISISLSD
jgi:hypothetical protein